MNELWVARDANGDLCVFSEKPLFDERVGQWFVVDADLASALPEDYFPDLRPGECKRLILAEEQ